MWNKSRLSAKCFPNLTAIVRGGHIWCQLAPVAIYEDDYEHEKAGSIDDDRYERLSIIRRCEEELKRRRRMWAVIVDSSKFATRAIIQTFHSKNPYFPLNSTKEIDTSRILRGKDHRLTMCPPTTSERKATGFMNSEVRSRNQHHRPRRNPMKGKSQ